MDIGASLPRGPDRMQGLSGIGSNLPSLRRIFAAQGIFNARFLQQINLGQTMGEGVDHGA